VITRWIRLRIFICALVLGVLGIKVARRAFFLQVVQSEELRARGEEQSLREIELLSQRGRILDRNGMELAGSAQFDSVSCNPRVLLQIPDGPARLARALGMDGRQLRRSLEASPGRFFSWVRRTVTPAESARVKALALPGVNLRKEPKRIYPRNEIAATVIGHANVDGKGVEGVEKAFEEYLRGSPTRLYGVKDGNGRQMLLDGLVDRKTSAGKDIVLALDQYLSHVTQKALAGAVEQWHAKGGVAIIMDPNSGELLAMASAPTYDPEDPGDAVAKGATRNRAITDILEPGSTMKTFTLAATLDAGKVRPSDMFDCQSGRPLMIGNTRIRDLHPEGVIPAEEVYQRSSNIGTVKIARQLGKQKLYDALVRFGFGRRTGVGLGGEVPGMLRPVSKWGEVHFANIAFGQGLAVTPLQMVTGYAAIANGGTYRAPKLALKVLSPDGRSEPLPVSALALPDHRVVSPETARTMLSIMKGVTGAHGTATQAAMAGYAVAGKTGTAQKVKNGHYNAWIGSFIGIVPADKPRLVIGVFIDEPEPEHRGGMVAAPAFRAIAEAAVRYLGLPPNELLVQKDADGKTGVRSAAETAALTALAGGTSEGAGAKRGQPDDNDLIEGPGSDQPLWAGPEAMDDPQPMLGEIDEPEAEVATERGGGEVEPTEAAVVAVPSFVGMSIAEAIRAAADAGVELALEGSGVAVAQTPGPGPLRRGSLCRVSFRPGG
jgi:cell division protein FtsI (penicillin-binding protein 3)